MAHDGEFISNLVSEEVRRVVADAIQDRSPMSASHAAQAILKIYPSCGFTRREIADLVIIAAAKAGVVVELGK